ncbi:ABC transporter substrate-binding protein [Paenibacillus cremeus]|uniref:ABC transporter substrate-binding protein n=1 Tax=Paenibacillus cremeus TaxID=2163881 RepID=A0A559JPS0_9BACL|nr:ABC transporter substrate-binding protein [Paenibacillus cremeus]TVY01871.1 ABC transporter substrate-binding protein [Paenibacillus cremeus]
MKKASFALLALMMAVTSGCGASKTTTDSAPAASTASNASTSPAPEKDITLTFWSTTQDLYADMTKKFEAQNPHIKIKADFMGDYDAMEQKVLAAVVAGNLPNVVQLGQRYGIPQVADSGKLIPIEQFMTDQEKQDVYPALWDRFRYKDKLWTIPFNSSTPVLYYNKTMLDKAGLKAPSSWDELVAAAKKLTQDTNGDGKSDVWGFSSATDTPWYFQALVWDRGGAFLDPSGKPTVNSKAVVDTLKGYQDLVNVEKAMAPNQHKTAGEDFTAGKLAMMFWSGSSLKSFQKQVGDKFEIGVAFLPSIQSRNVPIGGNSLGIFKSDKDTEAAAWKFVQFLTNAENAAQTSMTSGYAPIRKTAADQPQFKDLLGKDPLFKTIMEQNQYLKANGISPADAVIWNGLVTAQEKVEGDPMADPKALLDKLQADVESYLKGYK